MIEFIKKGNLPTAFFIATDTIATGVLKALYENKISVPNDISLIDEHTSVSKHYAHCLAAFNCESSH